MRGLILNLLTSTAPHLVVERVILLHVVVSSQQGPPVLAEFVDLAKATQANIVDTVIANCHKPHPKYFIGKGKVDELAESVAMHHADLVLVNQSLSPSQERNLEQVLKCRVCDRVGLILDIFAKRAQTHEGKLQVELAQLRYHSTRLVRGWTHLERQRGGRIGLTGPGETQLELDRRLLRDRIKHIQAKLKKVRQQRQLGRNARHKAGVPLVALVGYTNAGKTSLFNVLSGAEKFAANQLFATLDPSIRRIKLPGLSEVVMADTVGFIRHLPHDLVEAFRATLEEVSQADLLVHVIDLSDPEHIEYKQQVECVLKQLGADLLPRLEVYNKIDQLEQVLPAVELCEYGARIWLSVMHAKGLDLLIQTMSDALMAQNIQAKITLLPQQSKFRAMLYDKQAVVAEDSLQDGRSQLEIAISKQVLLSVCRQCNVDFDTLFRE